MFLIGVYYEWFVDKNFNLNMESEYIFKYLFNANVNNVYVSLLYTLTAVTGSCCSPSNRFNYVIILLRLSFDYKHNHNKQTCKQQ